MLGIVSDPEVLALLFLTDRCGRCFTGVAGDGLCANAEFFGDGGKRHAGATILEHGLAHVGGDDVIPGHGRRPHSVGGTRNSTVRRDGS